MERNKNRKKGRKQRIYRYFSRLKRQKMGSQSKNLVNFRENESESGHVTLKSIKMLKNMQKPQKIKKINKNTKNQLIMDWFQAHLFDHRQLPFCALSRATSSLLSSPFLSPFFSLPPPFTSKIVPQLLRRGHANLLCIVPMLIYVSPRRTHFE